MFVLTFVGKVGKHEKDRYHIEIPEEVLIEKRELVEELYKSNRFVVVIVLPIHGVHRLFRVSSVR